jgi:signal transduction histidine kinase
MNELKKNSGLSQDMLESLYGCLYRIGRLAENIQNPESLLKAMIEECQDMFDCEGASVALYNPEHDELTFTVVAGGATGTERSLQQWRIPAGTGIVGHVARERVGLLSNDPENDPRWLRENAEKLGFETRNLAAIPMLKQGELVGVLEVINRKDPGGFSEKDLKLLQIFADQAAILIELQKTLEDKKESDRLANFGVSVADAAHTIKNRVHLLKGMLDVIDKLLETEQFDELEGPWNIAKRAVNRISVVCLDMLNYSKPAGQQFQDVDVNHLLHDIVESAAEQATQNGITISLDIDREDRPWPMNEKMVQESIENLVGNAIEAMAENCGSSLEIRAWQDQALDTLILTVADNGPGIPEELQSKIFDPFFSTRGSRGTGLGLTSAKKTMDSHRGELSLSSSSETGSTFKLVFPSDPS